ncbi:MAG: hypothetical protein U0841_19000 [Chloroflexia bacterium]
MGGAATVVSNTPPPFGGQQIMMPASNTLLPQSGANTPRRSMAATLRSGVTPPMGMNQPGYNQPTVVGTSKAAGSSARRFRHPQAASARAPR